MESAMKARARSESAVASSAVRVRETSPAVGSHVHSDLEQLEEAPPCSLGLRAFRKRLAPRKRVESIMLLCDAWSSLQHRQPLFISVEGN